MALTTDLVAYWSLEDANDAHGSNNLTNNNTVTFTTGKVANAGSFASSSSQYLSVASSATLQTGDIDFTIACWVKATTLSGNMDIVAKWQDFGFLREYMIIYNSSANRFRFVLSDDGSTFRTVTADVFGAPSAGTWYFIVAQHDSVNNVQSISVNAGTANTVSYSLGVNATTTDIQIGVRETASTYWNGQVDEVGFWKRVLTGSEIAELYNGGSGRDYAYISGGGGGGVARQFMHYQKTRAAA